MEGGGRSKNLHLLCLALNNLLRDLKEALCDQRQMSTDLRLYFPCASAVEGGSSFVGGCYKGSCQKRFSGFFPLRGYPPPFPLPP